MSMDGERFRLHATAILLLVKKNKVLLCRRFNTGWEDGKYGFMAGHIDGGESFVEALCREAKEELGITIRRKDVQFVHVQHHISNKEYVYMYFTAGQWAGEPSIQEPDKCDDMQWFSFSDLPHNLVADTGFILDCYRQGITYSESGFRRPDAI